MRVTLMITQSNAFDGSGNAVAQIGPIGAREVWYPDTISVSASSNTNEATCGIYTGGPTLASATFADRTFSGSSGDSTQNVTGPIRTGQYVWASWTGGDPGAIGTVTITGEREI